MLRRHTFVPPPLQPQSGWWLSGPRSQRPAVVERGGGAATSTTGYLAALRIPTRSLFGTFGKPSGGTSAASVDSKKEEGQRSGQNSAASPFPPGFDPQNLQSIQQLFSSQPKEKQEQMMRQAMEMQKMMSKIPGLGKLTQKNTALLEKLMQMQPPASPAPQQPASPSSTNARRDVFTSSSPVNGKSPASGGRGTSSNGPSLDELNKVNLGPEIEALFQELRTIRQRKNEYRDKLLQTETSLATAQRELTEVSAREVNLRSKLAKAEQEVMLVTSENMDLRDSRKAVKQLTQVNGQLKAEVEQLKAAAQSSAAPGTVTYATLQHQLRVKDDALRSVQRKVDRMRRRDPLLQFSLACSDVSRLCGLTQKPVDTTLMKGDAGQEAAEQAFTRLQAKYQEQLQSAWKAAAHGEGAAANAYVAVARRYVLSCVPHSTYDAVIEYSGDLAELQASFEALGFTTEPLHGEEGKAQVIAAPDSMTLASSPGPFGYAFALRVATCSDTAAVRDALGWKWALPFTVINAHPFVSPTLIRNKQRCAVTYETARASGPGGQATNVTETQIYAKLSIDGVAAFTAEAQDSRSALSNKEAALEKLHQQRRLYFNDSLARQERAEVVQSQLVAAIQEQGGFSMDREVEQLVQEGFLSKAVMTGDAACVKMLSELGRISNGTTPIT